MAARRDLLALAVLSVFAAPLRAEGSGTLGLLALQAASAAPLLTAPNASASPLIAQPNASAAPMAAFPDTAEMLARIGALVKDGRIGIEADLLPGSMPVMPKYTLDVQGTPKTSVAVEAVDGKVTHMKFTVENGQLAVRGSGLRPKVAIESMEFQDPKGITDLKFHGLGIWRPIVAIFGGIARSAVAKLHLNTDVPSVLKGEIFGAKKATPAPGAPVPAPTPVPAAPPPGAAPPSTPSFMDLIREVRINEMEVTAYGGREMALRPFIDFRTAPKPSGEAMKVSIDKGIFRPGHAGAPNYVELSGRLDGEIVDGEMEFEANRVTIAKGEIRKAEFQGKTGEDGKVASTLSAARLFFELSSGNFVVPGGMGVALDSGSTFEVDRLKVTSAGRFSGVAKLDLAGKTGELSRQGATISAANIRVKTPGLTVVDGRATGPLEVNFDYQLNYPFLVKYPIKEIPEKKLDLDFHGPFAAKLALHDAGANGGEVTGTYVFKAPWDPIEQAALVALAAKWQQDLALKHVDFTITPKMFRPCGESCFTLGIEVVAEKRSSTNRLKTLFSQFCAPVGKANLFIDKPARAFVLKDLKIETHCKGIVGWFVNFLTPFLTKTYGDMKLFQMPANLPLTVDSVRGGAQLVEIGGSIDWTASKGKPDVPPRPQPVDVEPGK
ncbi:MAG TPA: hypothetical protein VMN82_05235 [Thermoanaerobaculia bacterium]|nr:hypothetical protein [Thermoanaerobaculia bacterium]